MHINMLNHQKKLINIRLLMGYFQYVIREILLKSVQYQDIFEQLNSEDAYL